jgi:integrase
MQKRWYGRTREHKAILAAGGKLPPWIPFTVTPYDLRHSFCTACRNLEPPVELHTVIVWMGHADATMILRIYDDVTGREASEAERLKSAFRSQNGSQGDS